MDFGDYHGVTSRVDPEIGYPHEFKPICNCIIPAYVKKCDDGGGVSNQAIFDWYKSYFLLRLVVLVTFQNREWE